MLPATVEHLLGRYLDDLPLGIRTGVETAALLGRDGSLARLARCTGREELDEIEALDAVGDGRLLHVWPIDGRYQFVHELARHTVTAQIPPGRAMRLHLAIADGLQGEPQSDVFAIAHHLRLAMPVASPHRAAAALLAASRRPRAGRLRDLAEHSPSMRSTPPTRSLPKPMRWCWSPARRSRWANEKWPRTRSPGPSNWPSNRTQRPCWRGRCS